MFSERVNLEDAHRYSILHLQYHFPEIAHTRYPLYFIPNQLLYRVKLPRSIPALPPYYLLLRIHVGATS